MAYELSGDVARGRRMAGEIVERRVALVDAVFRVRLAEKPAHARLMPIRLEEERARLARFAIWTCDAPTGQNARQFDDVSLRVTGPDAQRVQFENLPR